ncbi:hypothetical protein ABPG72_009438 [Tetrahymena utriculariae]
MDLYSTQLFAKEEMQFINKETLFVQEYLHYQTDPSLLILNQHNYMFGVRIKQFNFLNRPLFNITLEQRNYYQNDRGNQQKAKILQLVPCTEQHQKKFDGSYNFTNHFNLNKLEDQMYLAGVYNNNSFSFLIIYVSNCVNATSPRILGLWDPVCASQEGIDNELKTNGAHGFSFVMTSSVINIQNQTQWYQYYLNDDHYFTLVPKQMAKSTNTYLRLYNLTSDVSL